jgi:hypothetical protein
MSEAAHHVTLSCLWCDAYITAKADIEAGVCGRCASAGGSDSLIPYGFTFDEWWELHTLMQDVQNGDLSDWDVAGWYFPPSVYFGYPAVQIAPHPAYMIGDATPPDSAARPAR